MREEVLAGAFFGYRHPVAAERVAAFRYLPTADALASWFGTAMAVHLAPHNIRVNGVVPNKIGSPVGKDEFDPTRPVVNLRGRHGLPLDMARAVLFLVSEDSDFIVGDLLFVDGGVSAILVGDAAATNEVRPAG